MNKTKCTWHVGPNYGSVYCRTIWMKDQYQYQTYGQYTRNMVKVPKRWAHLFQFYLQLDQVHLACRTQLWNSKEPQNNPRTIWKFFDLNFGTLFCETSKYPKVPQSTQKYLKVPKSPKKYLKVPRSTSKYLEVPQSNHKYLRVTRSTSKYLEVP